MRSGSASAASSQMVARAVARVGPYVLRSKIKYYYIKSMACLFTHLLIPIPLVREPQNNFHAFLDVKI
jgi:hypothetical protein